MATYYSANVRNTGTWSFTKMLARPVKDLRCWPHRIWSHRGASPSISVSSQKNQKCLPAKDFPDFRHCFHHLYSFALFEYRGKKPRIRSTVYGTHTKHAKRLFSQAYTTHIAVRTVLPVLADLVYHVFVYVSAHIVCI